jgi:hypothetical protein
MVTLRNLTICFVVIFFSHATPSLCRELHFDSTDRYNIRWGKQEGDADLVKCRHGLTVGYSFGPACFKKGSYIIVSLVLDDTPEDKVVVDWHHVENGLYRAIGVDSNGNPVTEETAFMSLPVQEQGQGVGKVFIMGPLPDWIEWCVLKVRVIFVHQGKQGRVGVSALHWCEIFTVLDKPKAPMDPAWVSVLRISCQWARGENTPDGAANMLTQRLWENGEYNGGYTAYTRYVCDGQGNCPSDASEYFYLKKFIESGFQGQCNDFADFLVCLINSIGAFQSLSQRTHPLGSGAFRTQVIDPAGSLQPDSVDWSYHQFCIHGNDVWDGCLAFVTGSPAGPPKKLSRDTIYYDGLVAYYIFGAWNPSPPSGFIPGVYALELPQWCSQTNRNAPCRGTGYGPNCPSP